MNHYGFSPGESDAACFLILFFYMEAFTWHGEYTCLFVFVSLVYLGLLVVN